MPRYSTIIRLILLQMMCCSLRSHCANSVYVALFFSLDLLSEPVFVGEVVSGPQDSVL